MDNALQKAFILLGTLVLWTFLSILPKQGFDFLPLPIPEVVPVAQAASFHDAGYENSWVQFKDEKERLVQVQAIESRIVIVFRVKNKGDLARFNIGWMAPVTFKCAHGYNDCDIGSQEKTYIGNTEVQPTIWKTYGPNLRLKIQKN
ncbi:MAG: hypothetical protein WD989_00520 [Candidatus Paceibacterota bacterium]